MPDSDSPPTWAKPDDEADLREQLKAAVTPEDKQLVRRILRDKFKSEMKDLTRWWVSRMLNTTSPFVEKMTLFWHGHFATSVHKVEDGETLYLVQWEDCAMPRDDILKNFPETMRRLGAQAT